MEKEPEATETPLKVSRMKKMQRPYALTKVRKVTQKLPQKYKTYPHHQTTSVPDSSSLQGWKSNSLPRTIQSCSMTTFFLLTEKDFPKRSEDPWQK